jgi:alpha-galactosidase
VWLDSLDLTKMVQRRGAPRAGKSGAGRGNAPPPLSLGGVIYERGIGTLSINELIVDLKGQATRFESIIGIDDAAAKGQGSVTYEIWVDNKQKFVSSVIRAGDPPQKVSIELAGARFLELSIDDGNDVSTGDYADWANAIIHLKPGATARPESWSFPSEPAEPIASGWPAAPRINPPRITGGTPGRPFLFRIPATGDAPLAYAARNLSEGLTLDQKTGTISGAIARAGRTDVQITVTNAKGKATGTLTIVGGDDALALTPPLGWNSWNAWGNTVTAERVRLSADGMVASGLHRQGYTYINIDDVWEGATQAALLQPNESSRHESARRLRARQGLKIGIYRHRAHGPAKAAGQLPARDRCARGPRGASICSSTIGAHTWYRQGQ